jgi:hypothetical protein
VHDVTDPTRDPVDVKPHRKAFRELTREHDRLLMLLVDPRSTSAEIEEQLEQVTRAANEYLHVAHSEI